MTGQARSIVAVESFSQSSDPRLAVLDQWNKLQVSPPQKGSCEGTVDHLKSLLDQERTHYGPCLDYFVAIAASSKTVACSSSSSSFSSLSSSGSSPSSNVDSGSLTAAPIPILAKDRVNEAWRRKLCEWCFEVVDHFGMEREVVSVAMNYLDRMVAKNLEADFHGNANITGNNDGCHVTKRQFQLVAVASLYIAVKLHGESEENDIDRSSLNVDVFVELSRGFFKSEAIEAMERNILFSLDWHLNPPTPLKFISSLLRLMPNWSAAAYTAVIEEEDTYERDCQPFQAVFKAVFDIAMYLTELSVCVSTFTFHSKNSVVAYAAILCALEALEDTLPLPYDARVRFVNRTAEATGMLPETEEVRCVRNLLCELCPSIKERDVASLITMGDEVVDDDDDAGKSSPICVSLIIPQDQGAIRKHDRFYDY